MTCATERAIQTLSETKPTWQAKAKHTEIATDKDMYSRYHVFSCVSILWCEYPAWFQIFRSVQACSTLPPTVVKINSIALLRETGLPLQK